MDSPCVNICKLDKAGRLCTGCGRTAEEIARWRGMSKAQRRAVMERLRKARDSSTDHECFDPPPRT